ncbi:hypothetical protein [Luteitalea sp.]
MTVMRNPLADSFRARLHQLQAERSWRVARLEVAERTLATARRPPESIDAAAFAERRRRELAEHDDEIARAEADLTAAASQDAPAVRLLTAIAWSNAAAARGDIVALPRGEAERLVAAGAAVLHAVEASPIDGTTH